MATVATYLNFAGKTEEAFTFYSEVFGSEISAISRYGDLPPSEGQPELDEDIRRRVLNVQLPILGGHLLMGSDIIEAYGMSFEQGNSTHIVLMPDARGEADRLFAALSAGGNVEMPIAEQFWGDYYGAFSDRYGVSWMINCTSKD